MFCISEEWIEREGQGPPPWGVNRGISEEWIERCRRVPAARSPCWYQWRMNWKSVPSHFFSPHILAYQWRMNWKDICSVRINRDKKRYQWRMNWKPPWRSSPRGTGSVSVKNELKVSYWYSWIKTMPFCISEEWIERWGSTRWGSKREARVSVKNELKVVGAHLPTSTPLSMYQWRMNWKMRRTGGIVPPSASVCISEEWIERQGRLEGSEGEGERISEEWIERFHENP